MENKTNKNFIQKYLVYPFGEILLLVIGIIIAIQINTWYAKKVEVKKANMYLRGLHNNLKANIKNNDIFIERYKEELDRVKKFNLCLCLVQIRFLTQLL